MSVLPNQTNINVTDEFFVNDVANISFISSINVFNGSLNTGHIQLDQVGMDCAVLNSSPTLLLNGIPVASVSSFASSITQWASYPALASINYATGVGSGGAINMANVNALSNVSSATATFGTLSSITSATIGGFPYPLTIGTVNRIALPNPPSTVLNIQNGQIVQIDFTGQPAGMYLIVCFIQTGGVDPWTCQFIATVGTVAGVLCSGTHIPSFNPYGSQPTISNMVTAQCASASSPTVDIMFFSNGISPNGIIGSTAQFQLYRLY